LKDGEILGGKYFHDFLQTVCRIDANDTALESYGKCATFAYRKCFLNLYGLNTNSNMVKIGFEHGFLKSLSKWGK
jgi:hypothetical protein